MKIILLITNLHFGGAERICSLVANKLAQRGYNIVIILKNNNEARQSYNIDSRINIINLKASYIEFLPKLKRSINTEKPDVILSFLTPMNVSVTLLKIFRQIKAKVIIRETTIKSISNKNKPYLKRQLVDSLIKFTYRKADLIIALSDGCKIDLERHYRVPSAKTIRIYNPIDVKKVQASSEEEVNYEIIKNNNKTIICVATYTLSKGHKYLIDAVSILNKKKLNYNLVLIGEGALKKDIKEYANKKLRAGQLEMIKHTNNPFAHMKEADVLVLPSLWEGFGNVLIEAMAVKTPVISTNCESGPKEIITNNQDGILVEPKNPEELANSIEIVLEHKGVREKLVKNSLESLNRFNIDIIVDEYENAIKMIKEISV